MRLASAASLSNVNSGTCEPILLNASACVFGLRGDTAIGSGARRNQIFHQALLDGSVSALRIFPLKIEVRQLLLRFVHAGFGELPEIRCPIGHPNDDFLIRSLGRTGQHQADGGDHTRVLHVSSRSLEPARNAPVFPPLQPGSRRLDLGLLLMRPAACKSSAGEVGQRAIAKFSNNGKQLPIRPTDSRDCVNLSDR